MLNSPDIPSILIETGYLTNPEEAQRLSNRNFQERMALAIADGVANYFAKAAGRHAGCLAEGNSVIPTSWLRV